MEASSVRAIPLTVLLSTQYNTINEVLRHVWGTGIFLEPPVKAGGESWLALPGVEEEAHRIVQAFENNEIGYSLAKARLAGLVQQCRNRAQGIRNHEPNP